MSAKNRIQLFSLFVVPLLAALSIAFIALTSSASNEVIGFNGGAFVCWIFVGAVVSASTYKKHVIERENIILHAGMAAVVLLPLLFFTWANVLSQYLVDDWALGIATLLSHTQAAGTFFVLSHAEYPARD